MARGGYIVGSSRIVTTAESWRMTTTNSIRLIWISPVAVAVFVVADQWMSNQYWSLLQKAPPPSRQASPKTGELGVARDHVADLHFPAILGVCQETVQVSEFAGYC